MGLCTPEYFMWPTLEKTWVMLYILLVHGLHIMKLTLGKKLLYYSKRTTDRYTFLLTHKYSGTAGTVEPTALNLHVLEFDALSSFG